MLGFGTECQGHNNEYHIATLSVEKNTLKQSILLSTPTFSVTNELLHSKIPMQMYALGAQSGTTVLYHSWAGLAATMNKSHGTQQDSSARIANYLGKAHDSSPTGR